MSRRTRWALVPLAGSIVVGVAGWYVTENPRGYVALDRYHFPTAWWLAAWSLFALAAYVARPSARLVVLLAIPTFVLGFYTWAFAGFEEATRTTLLDRAVSADGTYEARLVTGYDFIDPFWQVRIRTRDGLRSRERVVWTWVTRASQPVRLRNIRPHTVDIVADDGAVYTATF